MSGTMIFSGLFGDDSPDTIALKARRRAYRKRRIEREAAEAARAAATKANEAMSLAAQTAAAVGKQKPGWFTRGKDAVLGFIGRGALIEVWRQLKVDEKIADFLELQFKLLSLVVTGFPLPAIVARVFANGLAPSLGALARWVIIWSGGVYNLSGILVGGLFIGAITNGTASRVAKKTAEAVARAVRKEHKQEGLLSAIIKLVTAVMEALNLKGLNGAYLATGMLLAAAASRPRRRHTPVRAHRVDYKKIIAARPQ